MRKIVLVVFLIFIAFAGRAGAAGTGQPLTFDQAVALALQNNPAYLATRSDVEAAQARLSAARGPLGPSFSVSDTYQLADPVAKLQTPLGALPFAPNSTNVPLAAISFTLADGGLTAARISEADARLAATRAAARESQTTTIGRVASAYYDLAAALGSAGVADHTVAVSEQHVQLVQQRLSAGIAARADLLQTQTQLADARVRAIDARNAVDRASDTLDAVLGVPLGTVYAPTEQLDKSPSAPSLESALQAARTNRGELAAANDAIVAAQAALRAARAGRAPHIGITAGEGNVQPAIEPGFHSQFTAGLSAVWTAFDNGITSANVAEAEAAIRRATLELQGLQTSVELEVRQSYDDLLAAQQRVAAARALADFASENLRLAEIRYRGGVGTILELRDAELQQSSAQQTIVSAQAHLQRSAAALRVATGLQGEAK